MRTFATAQMSHDRRRAVLDREICRVDGVPSLAIQIVQEAESFIDNRDEYLVEIAGASANALAHDVAISTQDDRSNRRVPEQWRVLLLEMAVWWDRRIVDHRPTRDQLLARSCCRPCRRTQTWRVLG